MLYRINTQHGDPTLETSAVVRQQQGSWRWQIRLCKARYIAVYSDRSKAWLWKSIDHSASFSGGNLRGNHFTGDGSKHNRRLSGIELAALAVVRGEA